MKRTSLERRLVLGTASALIGVVLAFGAFVLFTAHRSLRQSLDRSLQSKARALAGLYTYDEEEFEFEYVPGLMSEFQRLEKPDYFQIWLDDRPLARSRSLAGKDLLRPRSGAANIALPDGRDGRVATLEVRAIRIDEDSLPPPPFRLIIAVASDLRPVNEPFEALFTWVSIAGLSLILLSLLLSIVLVRSGLAPLHRLAAAIGNHPVDALDARFPHHQDLIETEALVLKLNDFLERLAAIRERERAFSGEVAHELRTPLAGLFSKVEVALQKPRSAEEYAAEFKNLRALLLPLLSLVDILLSLSRFEAVSKGDHEDFELQGFVDACWDPHSEDAAEKNLSFDNGIPEDLSVCSRSDLFILVLSNAFKNAVTYSNTGGDIQARAEVHADHIALEISNSGCKLGPEEIGLVFESFWRGDRARTSVGKNFGLGLSLVRKIIQGLKGKVSARLVDERFVLEIQVPKTEA